MEDNFRERKEKNYSMMRAIGDYGRGVIIFCFGIFLVFAEKLGFYFSIEPFLKYFFAAMCIIYGGWRIYRGYQKNYFK
ncbi:hypothetical protein [Pinibacter soli]|uniref:Uncharacterized protein n=1 Tax=Pinibacter soli TaxID=3044211 RepID=A0ABT6R6J3_9BACT|nr:hypothetical protein [Pinibacter soli]MDI3318188.1 hypothetical protein [Pinibacter soli]